MLQTASELFFFFLLFLHLDYFNEFFLFFTLTSLQIILFQFGLGTNAHYVILELYAQGNILLTDSDFMVLTLLRSHRLVIQLCILFNEICMPYLRIHNIPGSSVIYDIWTPLQPNALIG